MFGAEHGALGPNWATAVKLGRQIALGKAGRVAIDSTPERRDPPLARLIDDFVNVKAGTAADLSGGNNKIRCDIVFMLLMRDVVSNDTAVGTGTNPQWTLEDAGDGFFRIKNGSGKYLSVEDHIQNGARAIGSNQQTWKILPNDQHLSEPGYIRIFLPGTHSISTLRTLEIPLGGDSRPALGKDTRKGPGLVLPISVALIELWKTRRERDQNESVEKEKISI
ncbi:carbohydrate-binding module family 13 protein [Hydnum rufescens UP504]|uniref:Carbohydrate-binding module family 13 protein n=1 Tax=Hydnum rufescens UP504 TaxID=1448309 RepID=A0A9P6B1R3_9AGAM|nr:carbohydrate-binding module family 13 protein [Hydnum rufescens UP504]